MSESANSLQCDENESGRTLACDAIDNIGLKQAFPDKPGWIGLRLLIQFPTRGSYALDYNYLVTKIKEVEITLQYSEHK